MSMKILYVDDERDLLELASTFFLEENIPLDTAAEFETALEMIRANRYDMIIADLRMPSGSGIELVTIAREEDKFNGRFILVSGDMKSSEELTKIGCDHMMNKPVDFFALIDIAKELLKDK